MPTGVAGVTQSFGYLQMELPPAFAAREVLAVANTPAIRWAVLAARWQTVSEITGLLVRLARTWVRVERGRMAGQVVSQSAAGVQRAMSAQLQEEEEEERAVRAAVATEQGVPVLTARS